MELLMDDKKLKKMLSEILMEMIVGQPELFRQLFIDAIEEIGLSNAIREGKRDELVGGERIISVLSHPMMT